MPRVLHIITGLRCGGAETMLSNVVRATAGSRYEAEVISFVDKAELADEIRAAGVPVHSFDIGGATQAVRLLRLPSLIRSIQPDIVQTWMYHADLIGGIAARVAGSAPVVWNIRNSEPIGGVELRSTTQVARLSARLSYRLPAAILVNSTAGRDSHTAIGYDSSRMHLIPNGVDTDRFRPDPAARQSVREEFGLTSGTPLIGLVGRFHPQKDHRTFVTAAATLHRWRSDVHFLLCGPDIEPGNAELVSWLREAGLEDNVHLLGIRRDMPRLQASLDLATSSSCTGEGFSNAIAEAMACGVPGVVTDAGDSSWLVGTAGVAVPVREPQALAAGWREMLGMSAERRALLGFAARQRIATEFSIPAIAEQYLAFYDAVLGQPSTVPVQSIDEVRRTGSARQAA